MQPCGEKQFKYQVGGDNMDDELREMIRQKELDNVWQDKMDESIMEED